MNIPSQPDKPALAPPAPQAAGAATPANPFLHLLILALVALAAYSNTFSVPFVLDDQSSIVENRVIQDLSGFLSGNGYAYNPRRFIGYLTFALNYSIGGLDTTGYHVVNLSVHIIAGWLVYLLVRLTLMTPCFGAPEDGNAPGDARTPDRTLLPLLAALLFVAHPVQTQAVTYIVQRLASLAAMFYLLSVVLYVQGRLVQERTQKPLSTGAITLFLCSMTAAVLAMGTKEMAATLPLSIVLYEFFFFKAGTRKKLFLLVPFLILLLIVPLSMMAAGGSAGALFPDIGQQLKVQTTMGRGTYLLTQLSVVATYIRLIFLPIAQNLDYDYPVYHSLFEPPVFAGLVLIGAIIALALYLFQRSRRNPEPEARLMAFGIAWFFLTLSVESSLIPIADVIFEHRLYLPSAGALIAVSAGIFLLQRSISLKVVTAFMVCSTFLLAGTTWARNAVWKDSFSLWSDAVKKSPGKARPHFNLCKGLLLQDRLDEAYNEAMIAVGIDPGSAEAHNNLAVVFERKGSLDRALLHYQMAVERAPAFVTAIVNYGAACEAKGLFDAAEKQYREAARLDPKNFDAHRNLGGLHMKTGKFEEATGGLQAALAIDPEHGETLSNLGVCYKKTGRLDQAAALYRKALELKPDNVSALLNLGNVLSAKGDTAQAVNHYREAIRLQPRQSLGYVNLGLALLKMGQTAQALEQFTAAQQAVPGDPRSKELIAKLSSFPH